MRIIDHGTFYSIYFPFNKLFRRNLELVKGIPDRAFNAKDKSWTVPKSSASFVIELANKRGIPVEQYVPNAPELTGELEELPDLDIELPIKATLRNYQKKGVARSIQLRKVLNGDDMGLGKTLQSISKVVGIEQMGVSAFPCLVIVPSVSKENWRREWEKWTDRKALILTDSVKNTWQQYWKAGFFQVFITNYESLKKYFVESMPSGKIKMSKDIKMKDTISLFNSIIIDESHRLKDPTTLQTKLCARIAMGKENIQLLSGTPVMNKPIDLYTQLVILGQMKHFGGKKKAFSDRYCDGGRGHSNLKELNYLLNKHCFFRREKKAVLTELPDKQRQIYVCEISNRQEYDFAERNFIRFMESIGKTQSEITRALRAEALALMNQLGQISARGKINEVKEFADEVLGSGQKLILFCNLKAIVQELKKIYPDAVTITGDDKNNRQANIDKFQEDSECKLIICNLRAAGVSVTLTAASQVGFIEFPWTASLCQQAEDRANRMGQKNAVMCTYFLGRDTIDEKRYSAIMEKNSIANAITGGTDAMEMNMVDKLFNLFSNIKSESNGMDQRTNGLVAASAQSVG